MCPLHCSELVNPNPLNWGVGLHMRWWLDITTCAPLTRCSQVCNHRRLEVPLHSFLDSQATKGRAGPQGKQDGASFLELIVSHGQCITTLFERTTFQNYNYHPRKQFMVIVR